jgi:hypothetical protein
MKSSHSLHINTSTSLIQEEDIKRSNELTRWRVQMEKVRDDKLQALKQNAFFTDVFLLNNYKNKLKYYCRYGMKVF